MLLSGHAGGCCWPMGWDTCCTLNGNLEECERDLVEALQLARELDWAAAEAFAELFYGGTLVSFGQLGAGLEYAQQALHLSTEINHQQWIVRAHETLGRIYLALLAPEQALVHAKVGLEAAQGLGSASWIAFHIAKQVQAYTALGQL
jgi:hypothetical protein